MLAGSDNVTCKKNSAVEVDVNFRLVATAQSFHVDRYL